MDIHVAAIVADRDDVIIMGALTEEQLIADLIEFYETNSDGDVILSPRLEAVKRAFDEELEWSVTVDTLSLG